MKGLTVENINRVCQGCYHGPDDILKTEVTAISTDSRKIEAGSLYVPIVGARVDGHSFIGDVMEKGALLTLSEKDLGEVSFPWIQVASSLQAVKDIAEEYLKILKVPVVGISGSVGKTSTKEMIASILEVRFNVLKTLGNFNNELGLPLTVFRLRPEHEIAVLEMGISDFGEMTRLARIARPKVGVITNIGWCHLEFLKSRDGIFKAKTEMLDFIQPGGSIIVNGDDDKLCQLKSTHGIEPTFFGLSEDYPVWADEIEHLGLKGMRCRIHAYGETADVTIPLPGQHMVYNALCGTAVGHAFGMKLSEICRGIENLQSLSGRFNILDLSDKTVIDDCYNANPVSMKASLEVLQMGSGRKVAILGDMGELGSDEVSLHEEVGSFINGLDIDVLYTVGKLTKSLSEKADKPELKKEHFENLDAFMAVLSEKVKAGDTILVKASHFMAFENIVEALKKMDEK